MKPTTRLVLTTGAALAFAGGLSGPVSAAAPDWSTVPETTVELFYPGQSSYDWLLGPEHKKGGNRAVAEGEGCVDCHEGEQADIGELIVSGERLEPAPIEGKHGTIDLAVQAAYDADNLYFRFQWPTQMDRPGQMHDYIRFDGSQWAFIGGPRSSAKVPPLYEDRLAIMIDDGKVPGFAEHGCWLTCHDGMRDMPNVATKEQVQAHPLLGQALKQSDVRKYLPATRLDEVASWDQTRSADEIAELAAAGQFVDLMQWRAARSNAVGMADDGYVLEYRLFDDGKNPFSWNVDRKTMTPTYMFDAAKVGSKSLTEAEIGDPSKPFALIREQNAVPYDPDAGWQEGDVLPGRLLSAEDSSGSAADNSEVNGTWEDGTWTVVWRRPLDTGHPEDDKILEEGGVYTVGIAVHDDNVTTRFHDVSFPLTLGIGVEADIEAIKVE
jgi:hypothetical protein